MKRFIVSCVACLVAVVSMVVFVETFTNAAIGMGDAEVSTSTGTGTATTTTDAEISSSSSASSSSLQAREYNYNPTYPKRLSIPSLKIDASVQEVGVNSKGAIGVPTNFTDVAWYKYSAVPGTDGNSVIDGHVDNGLALAGVFKHISDIKVGNNIYVTTEQGKKINFVVTSIGSYDYKDISMDAILHGQEDTSHLWLITCGGTWLPDERTYNQRIVVGALMMQT